MKRLKHILKFEDYGNFTYDITKMEVTEIEDFEPMTSNGEDEVEDEFDEIEDKTDDLYGDGNIVE